MFTEGNEEMKVRKNTLLMLACVVWTVAGFQVLHIGIKAYQNDRTIYNIMISLLIFLLFEHFVFGKLVAKHTARIEGYGDKPQFFYKFFDGKSFAIMVVMMSGGIWLRTSNLVTEHFIAVFYSGLGSALLLAGILFGINFKKAVFLDSAQKKLH